jgi:anthranilate phosphoribosyltransferase
VVAETWRVEPAALGLEAGDPESLRGGSVAENAARLRSILDGRERSAASEAVALNAAAALHVAGLAAGLAEGVTMARELLRSGAAGERLRRLVQRSQELADGG